MLNKPESIQILITNKCNHNCRFCHFHCNDKNYSELSLNDIDNILKQSFEIGIKNIIFNGGEPFEYSDFRGLLKLTEKYTFRWHFVTNGYYFKEFLPLFQQYNMSSFTFGIDGMSSDTHDLLREKKGSFEKVMKAIQSSKKNGFYTQVQFILTKQNFHEFEDFLKFIIEDEIDTTLIHKLTHDGKAYNTDDMDLTLEQEKIINKILIEYKPQFKRPVQSTYFNIEKEDSGCNHLSLSNINIDWNGKINLCSLCPQFNFDFPSIKNKSLKEGIKKISKINEHFDNLRNKEYPDWSKKNLFAFCDYCIEKFSNNSEKYIFNIKCKKKHMKLIR